MHILLAHNFYGSSAPSGENTVFLAEKKLLETYQHQVSEFTRHSDEIRNKGWRGIITGAFSTPWNPFSQAAFSALVRKEQPDIIHIHNTFPLLSPAIFYAARQSTAATVLTLHNYRLFCAAGIPMRNHCPCVECLEKKSVLPALHNGCYRNSKLATLPLALMIELHRKMGTWNNMVDAFIVLTAFQKAILAGAGLPVHKIHIKPHFYADPPALRPWPERRPRVIFIGRLGLEKGVHVLIQAWKRWGKEAPVLDMIGDGSEKSNLEQDAAKEIAAGTIRFHGQLPFAQVQSRLARASLLILPSLCFEGFPMVIREALALGVPVAASRLGAMPEIIQDGEHGVLFTPGDPDDLLRQVKMLWQSPDTLAAMSHQARQEFETRYTPEINHDMLMMIYQAAIMERKRKHCV